MVGYDTRKIAQNPKGVKRDSRLPFGTNFQTRGRKEPQYIGGGHDPSKVNIACQTQTPPNCQNYCINGFDLRYFYDFRNSTKIAVMFYLGNDPFTYEALPLMAQANHGIPLVKFGQY